MKNFVFLFVIALFGASSSSVNVEDTNRIINGEDATYNQFRYMISLQRRNETHLPTRGHRCGGALVTLRHALTAASCLYDRIAGINFQISHYVYRVFAGAAVLTNDTFVDRIRGIESFTLHPSFSMNSINENNIAVITLDSAFPSNVVQTVPLSTADSNALQIEECTSSGWGVASFTFNVSTQLQYVRKTVYPQEACAALYEIEELDNPLNISNSMICATASQSYASCLGDIGNPLVCQGSLNGILIRGNDCQPSPFPEVYTRVSSFRPWIIEVTSGVSTFQPGMAVLAVIAVVQIITVNVLN